MCSYYLALYKHLNMTEIQIAPYWKEAMDKTGFGLFDNFKNRTEAVMADIRRRTLVR